MVDSGKKDIEKDSLASNRETPSTEDVGPTKDEDQDRPCGSWNDLIEIDKIEIEVVNEM